ncbi:MAG: hypothetical protein JEZ09_18765 [Salinivirgaceae bacterium]|nr:hypothetical protein [Salinivirgaceae bacterium]
MRTFNQIKILLLFAFIILSFTTKDKEPTEKDLPKLWKQVEEFDSKKLPKSALRVVDDIYKIATKEKNNPEMIKSLIHHIKYVNQIENDAIPELIKYSEKEIKHFSPIGKCIINSMLAEMYWNFYENNRWKIQNKTDIKNAKEEDISEWTFADFIAITKEKYKASLLETKALQETKVISYESIIKKGNSPEERPTLFDLLLNRAMDFYLNNEQTLDFSGQDFTLNGEDVFDSYKAYNSIDFTGLNQDFPQSQTLKLLQNWLTFRANDSRNEKALFFADLKRLEYVRMQSSRNDNEELYYNALERMLKEYTQPEIQAEIKMEQANYYLQQTNSFQGSRVKNSPFKDYKQKAHALVEELLTGETPKHIKLKAESIKIKLESINLDIKHSEVVFPNQKIPVFIEYKNTNAVYYSIHKISQAVLDKNTRVYDRSQFYNNLIKSGIKIIENKISLPLYTDFLNHSTEFLIDELPLGKYVISYSNNATFDPTSDVINYSMLAVSNISYIERSDENGAAEFFIAQRETGTPLTNTEAQLIYRNYDYRTREYTQLLGDKLFTNDKGLLTVENNEDNSRHGFILQIVNNGDTLQTENNNTRHNYNQKTNPNIKIFTDRAIYRPGQVVYYKALAIQNSKNDLPQIVTDLQTKITLKDANWQEVSKQNHTTNKYGTFSGSFVIPTGSLNGKMTLETSFGRKTIRIEEYKRPTFEVIIDEPKGQLKLNEDVKIAGTVMGFNGLPASNIIIKYRVARMPQYRWWWRSNNTERQIDFGEIRTNNEGKFEFIFRAHSGESKITKNSFYGFNIMVDAIDINGETQSDSKYISIGNIPLTIAIKMSDNLDKRNPDKINVSAKSQNGQAEKATIQLEIIKLKSPEKAVLTKLWETPDTSWNHEIENCLPKVLFLNANFKDELEKEKTVLNKKLEIDGDSNVLMPQLKKWTPGYYKISISSTDNYGNIIENQKYFTVFDSKAKKLSNPQILWTGKDKETLQPGEIVKTKIGTSEMLQLWYHIEFNNQLIHSELITLNNEIREFEWPVSENLRGGFAMHFSCIYKGQFFSFTKKVEVPFNNKDLKISYETFRDKLKPGTKESWTLKIEGPNGEKLASEIMAGMYDKSLDAFEPNPWDLSIYPNYFYNKLWRSHKFDVRPSINVYFKSINYPNIPSKNYDAINWFNALGNYRGNIMYSMAEGSELGYTVTKQQSAVLMEQESTEDDADYKIKEASSDKDEMDNQEMSSEKAKKEVQIRKNFNETAFFYPNLYTDENGIVTINFTLPESLTTWKFQTLAHTKDLEFGLAQKEIIAQKELMVEINAPRFVTQGDVIIIPAKVQNVSDTEMSGTVELSLSNPLTGASYNALISENKSTTFKCESKKASLITWKVEIPDTITALQYKVIASTAKHSDGEQKWIPVLSNKVLVTETKPLWVNGNETRKFTLDGLKNSSKSNTLTHHNLTLEMTANPSWYAVQALPYLLESEEKCTEQIFNAYYATEISRYIIESAPTIATMFKAWKELKTKRPFLSNLEQNQELKQALLKETPWVLDALNENEQKQRIALLFDENHLEMKKQQTLYLLNKLQYSNGAWPWFNGMGESRYVTQHLLTGFGKLKHLNLISEKEDAETFKTIKSALRYLDDEINKDYIRWDKSKLKDDEFHISPNLAQYLYMRSFYPEIPLANAAQEAIKFYKMKAKENWTETNKYSQAMLALAFSRENDKTANDIIKSIKEHALSDEEQGMYWKENLAGYYWYQAPIEFQSLMIELFSEVDKNKSTQNELKKWLLKNKQTNHWKTSRATADAIYALLSSGSNWIAETPKMNIQIGSLQIDEKAYAKNAEPGTAYYKKTWNPSEINETFSDVTISRTGEGISWGGLYWQYFEQIDKIKSAATDLSITKRIFQETTSDKGLQLLEISENTPLKPGSRVVVRLDFKTDRRMEFVHLKDARAASFEPTTTISGYQYNAGLSYYQSTHDASTDFFIEYLPVGNYTIEYKLNVTHSGTFSSGLATIQCMYAPEFNAHSEGMKMEVK